MYLTEEMSGTGRGLRVLVSGASGMVGKALVAQLAQPTVLNNFSPQVLRLVRRPTTGPDEVFWDPYEMRIDMKKIEGVDAVVHLAGALLADEQALRASNCGRSTCWNALFRVVLS